MLTIRLQRMGKKKAPTYRLVISEKARDTQAKSLEILGHYNPTQEPKVLELKADRIKHYLANGAQMSNTVHNILVNEGIVESKKKMKSVTITNKRGAKIAEKQEAAEAQKKEAEEAKKAAEEEAKAAAEAEAEAQKAAEETPAEEPQEDAAPEAEAPTEEVAEEAPAEEEKPAEEAPEAAEEKKEE